MDGGEANNPRTVEEVFRDFKGCRAGLVKALTTDVEEFYRHCDPGTAKKQAKEKSASTNGSSKRKPSSKGRGHDSSKHTKALPPKDEDEGLDEEEEDDVEEHENTLCGGCGENYTADEFWICCDICKKWFHGKGIKITPAKAEQIRQCPSSCTKRAET